MKGCVPASMHSASYSNATVQTKQLGSTKWDCTQDQQIQKGAHVLRKNAMIAILSLFALRMKAEEGTYRHWYATMADFKISFPTLSHPRHKCFHTTFWFTSNHFHYLNTLFTAILYYIYYMNIYPCSIAMNTIDSVVRYMPLMPQHT